MFLTICQCIWIYVTVLVWFGNLQNGESYCSYSMTIGALSTVCLNFCFWPLPWIGPCIWIIQSGCLRIKPSCIPRKHQNSSPRARNIIDIHRPSIGGIIPEIPRILMCEISCNFDPSCHATRRRRVSRKAEGFPAQIAQQIRSRDGPKSGRCGMCRSWYIHMTIDRRPSK